MDNNLMVDYQPGLFKCVSVYDPAIDHKESDIVKYQKTRDLNLLKFKNGEEPTYFYLRQLSSQMVSYLSKLHGDSFNDGLKIAYFQFAVEKIENIILSNGTKMPCWEPASDFVTAGGKKYPIISNAELAGHLFKPAVTIELGNLAYQLSFLMPGMALSLEPSPLCLLYMAQRKNQ